MLDRGERIELLVHKTDSLQAQAFTFRRQSRRLHHHMWSVIIICTLPASFV